jgi:glycosyltransferase involved in cell wall biosynthesis
MTVILFCRSNPIAPDPRVEKEARALVTAGHAVSAICWDRSASLASPQERDGFEIHRLAIRAGYANGLGNLPALLRWQWGLLRWLLVRRAQYDCIHACDFDTVLPALVLKFLFKKRVVYDIFDFYADHLRKTPAWLKKLIYGLDFWAISQADALILVDDARWEQVRGAKLPPATAVIYNAPEEPRQLPAIQARTADLRIAYIGLLQTERGLLEILDLLARHPNWHLDLAGFGGDEALLVEKARSLPNVTWHGRVPYDQALALSAAADVLFATYDPAIPNHRYSSPNKVFEAMMLGKPLVVSRDTNMDKIVLDANCGLVVDYGDVAQLEAAFARLADDAPLRQALGAAARRAYETRYGWPIMQKRLLDLYQQLNPKTTRADSGS